ncbi:MAG: AAA family ATPase [Eubacteriales bacterium]|nr:AAA family ATPase [Eubacteriales bacterium]
MNLSLTMEFVLLRAAQEASAFSGGNTGLEHLFLGILKVPEVKGADVVKDASRAGDFDREAEEVSRIARSRGWNTTALRRKLRSFLSGEKPSQNAQSEISLVLGSAAWHAEHDRQSQEITAADVLGAILRHPSPMIQALLEGAKPSSGQESAEEAAQEEAPPEPEGIAFLPVLTSRIRAMRYDLLSEVYGQDHAVHALAEGLFSAEVLAASDNRRKGPRAMFVFAGPPGVGKTFMAERAAAALRLPYRRLDMSSYADHQAHQTLIGFAPSFKDAKPGLLTGFVDQHPRCLLLIDEVEKAHRNTIQLFLQILDGGRLHDDYEDKDVDFRDTMIIFTTNAGRQLYGEESDGALSALSRQSILSALRTDLDPMTNQPFFPAPICSRLSTGFVLMFNHLNAYDRERICEAELKRFCALFEQQYGIQTGFDRLLPAALLFAEGASTDARALRAQAELFCKNEIYRLCGLWGEEHFEEALGKLRNIHFTIDLENSPENVRKLFVNPAKPEILVLGSESLCRSMQAGLPGFKILCADFSEEAFRLAGKQEPLFVLADMDMPQEDPAESVFDDPFAGEDWEDEVTTRLLTDPSEDKLMVSFDNIPFAAASIHRQVSFLKELRGRAPDLPVYLLESAQMRIDEELMGAFSRIGVRGKLLAPSGEMDVFSEQLEQLAEQCYLQKMAALTGAEQQILSFATEPVLSQDSHTAMIRLTELGLKRAVNAEDAGDLLDDVERSNVHFDDVIGADEAKEELQFFVKYLKNPKDFLSRGLQPPKGVLLYGPPGTGKTLLARAMAGEAESAFIATEATGFVTKWQGSGPESVRALFKKARRYAPSIVFIDEIDAIGRRRGEGHAGHAEEMALNALLTEMDGFRVDPRRPVFVLAATNYSVDGDGSGSPGSIDPALSRRFDRKILVELPNRDQRSAYLTRMAGAGSRVTSAMLERLAGRSAGMSLADLSAVLEQAARLAVRKNAPVSDEDLEEAFERIRHGSEKNWGESYMERVAYHEAGHALLSFLGGKTPSYVTIVARGSHGGYMEHADTEDTPLRTRQELLARIRTALGGRAAEIVRYGNEAGISTGASGDLSSATHLAAGLLLQYGMDEAFGLAALSPDAMLRGPLSEKIHARINTILREQLGEAVRQLSASRDSLDRLAQALLRQNKLTGDEIEALM